MGRSFGEIGLVKHPVVNGVTDLISFSAVVGPVDANQKKASLNSDSPPKRLPCEENNSIHWCDRTAAADGKRKKHAVEMNRGGLWGRFRGTIAQLGL